MTDDPGVRFTPHHLVWDSDQAYDPETLQPVVPAWRLPYHRAAATVRRLQDSDQENSREHQ